MKEAMIAIFSLPVSLGVGGEASGGVVSATRTGGSSPTSKALEVYEWPRLFYKGGGVLGQMMLATSPSLGGCFEDVTSPTWTGGA